MTEEEILSGNKLIAEFIDLTPHSMFPDELQAPGEFSWMAVRANIQSDYAREDNEFVCFEDFFEFNSSWDWLMPVVEKMETLGITTHFSHKRCLSINRIKCDFEYDTEDDCDSNIEAVYTCVVKFIEWYNQNKQHD